MMSVEVPTETVYPVVTIPAGANPAAEQYVNYAETLLRRANGSTDPEWSDSLNRMAGQMVEIAIYLGAKAK